MLEPSLEVASQYKQLDILPTYLPYLGTLSSSRRTYQTGAYSINRTNPESTTTTTTMSTQTMQATKVSVTDDIPIPRGEAHSTLVFYAPPADGGVPFNYIETPPPGLPQRNFGEDSHEITLQDIRGRESEFDMNERGFGVLQNVSSGMQNADFNHDEKIEKTYYPEVESLLLDKVPGAKRVFIFDHTVRRSDPNAKRAPVNRARH